MDEIFCRDSSTSGHSQIDKRRPIYGRFNEKKTGIVISTFINIVRKEKTKFDEAGASNQNLIQAKVFNDGVFLPYKSAYAEKVYELIVGCVVACTPSKDVLREICGDDLL